MLQYFEHVEEAEWAVQVLKTTGKPVAASLCIGPDGDLNRVSPGDCAVRLVNAGTTTSHFTFLLNIRKMWRNNLLRVSLYLMTPIQTWFRAPSLRGDTSDWDVKGAVCKIWPDIWFKTIKKQTNIMLKMSAEGTKWNWQLVCYKNDTEMWTLDKDGFRLLVSHWWHIKSQWLSSSNRKLVIKSSMNQAVNDWGIKLELVSVRAAEVFVVWGIYKDKGKKMLTNKHILKHPRWWLTVTQLLSSITSFLIFSQAN